MVSQNNMKQIGISMHANYDVNRQFPSLKDGNGYAITVSLLPYLEQQNLYQLIQNNGIKVAEKTRLQLFISPLDPVAGRSEHTTPMNYLFNAGSKYSMKDNDGIVYENSKVKFNDIPDGTSLTLMTAETLVGDFSKKAVDVARQHIAFKKKALRNAGPKSGLKEWKASQNIVGDRCSRWYDPEFLQCTFTMTRKINDPRPDVNYGGAGGLSGFRTNINGTNIGMCDGSVRFINQNVSFEVLRKLATRSGKEAVPFDF